MKFSVLVHLSVTRWMGSERRGRVVSLFFRSDRVGFTVQLVHQTGVGMICNTNAHVLILMVVSSSAGIVTLCLLEVVFVWFIVLVHWSVAR